MNSQLGVGIMIKRLFGNDNSAMALHKCVGKTIRQVELVGANREARIYEDRLLFQFIDDGTKMSLRDDGQTCCESRYMTTDDDLSYFSGAVLMGAEVKSAPDIDVDYGAHEIAFLVVTTSKGAFTIETHNEHNGYYGGFYMEAVLEEYASEEIKNVS